MSEFLWCPFCRCLFLTQVDLDSHLAVFGNDVVEHERKLAELHREVWCDFDEW